MKFVPIKKETTFESIIDIISLDPLTTDLKYGLK